MKNSFRAKRFVKRTATLTLALALSMSAFSSVVNVPFAVAATNEITFKTQVGGIFDGMPLFDGNPDHLNAYVDAYFEYIGLEGAALYATGIRDNYTFVMDDNPRKGKTVPGGIAAADNPYGVSTDFASLLGLGQTWNKELAAQVGQVMGSEKISQLNVKQGTANIHNGSNPSKPIAFTAITDMRVNPLNGRFAEGYGEDPYLTATMVDHMSAGLAGTNQDISEDGFWQRAIVGTRHFTLYNAEWFRQAGSYNAGARAIYEYHAPSVFKAFSSGSMSGAMTAFGRTNGIPNIISPYLILGDKVARYGMYSSPDFNAENHLYGTNSGNGYDASYTLDRKHALALMVLAHSESTRASGTDKTDVVTLANAVKEGIYGITLKDVQDVGRPLINQLVRIGVFNEVDANGVPVNYPFANQAKDVSTNLTSYTTQAHQEVALQEARETVVLLKNTDGALPLSKTQKAAVGGLYADTRIVAQNGLNTPNIADASKSPLYSILNKIGTDKVQYANGNEVVALKSVANGQYLTAGSGAGGQLAANYTPVDNQFTDAQLFELTDWGQYATGLQSKGNGSWVTSPNANSTAIANTNTSVLYLTDSNWSSLTTKARTSTIPPKLRFEKNNDNTFSIVANGLGFQTGIFNGRFLTTAPDGTIATAASTIGTLDNFNNRTNDIKFEKTVVKEAGADLAAMAETQDYALLFIGADPRNSAAEGNDRSNLYMGENDYKLAKKVAASFAAKNKKTIVVVLANSPVIVDELQKDPNISAIVTQPYSGEFDSKGLTDVLFGDYAPTGRLTTTWYADMSALPNIDKYDIPEGHPTITSLNQLDPRFQKDMFDSDPVEESLTYMYTDADVTYPFGYGLGYADFTYSNFAAPDTASSSGTFQVAVEITNEGSITTSEVVQLYAKHNSSSYGPYAPKKKLVSYEKVELTPGEHKIVLLNVDPKDLAIWDVNRGDYITEDGLYTFMVGHSSEDIRAEKVIDISGDQLAAAKGINGLNVFDHSAASRDVAYREASKQRTVEGLRAEKIAGEYYVVMSKENGAWTAMPNVDFTGAREITARVASNGSGGVITLHADSPVGEPFATIPVPVTDKVTYTMPTEPNQTVNELGYVEVEAAVSNAPAGLHTVYVVFNAPDLRIDSLKVTESDITVSSPAPNAALTAGKVGASYNQQLNLAVVGGTEPYTWSVTGLPEGLSFDAATKTISGTPAAGADLASPYTVQITATDANNAAASVSNTLIIQAESAPGVLTAGLTGAANVYAGSPFSLSFELSQVTGPALAQDIEVSYDAGKVEFTGAESLVTGVSVVGYNADTPGTVRVLLASEGPDHAVTADGPVFKLNWNAKSLLETSTAAFQVVKATLSDGNTETVAQAGAPVNVQITYVNKQALVSLIGEVQAFHDGAVEGTNVGQYPAGSKAALQAAINAAVAAASGQLTQEQVQAAVEQLSQALEAFKQSVITQLPGDVNNDGKVSVSDLAKVAGAYGKTSASEGWNEIEGLDINDDNIINIQDLVVIARKILGN